MTLLLIFPAWLLLLSLIAGLCYAAHLGDSEGRAELRSLEAEGLADLRSHEADGGAAVRSLEAEGRADRPNRPSGTSRPARRAEIAA